MPLLLTCRHCGKTFEAGIDMDQASFNDPTNQIIQSTEGCPHCRKSAKYDKPDYRWLPF